MRIFEAIFNAVTTTQIVFQHAARVAAVAKPSTTSAVMPLVWPTSQ